MSILRLVCILTAFILSHLPAMAQTPAYVGSTACADCHRADYEAWSGSHHGEAWRDVGPGMLEGAFEGEEFSWDGMSARFDRKNDRLHVTVTEKDGVTTTYFVHSVGGTTPLQHLILETEPGKLQSFDVVWDVEKRQWYHLYPDQDLPPHDGLHWTGPYKNWNGRCAECHATGYAKAYDPVKQSYSSSQVEIGVGCEACHGPGEAHLKIVAGETTGDFSVPLTKYGFSADMASPQVAMEQCAGCHSRRSPFNDGNPLPGTAFHDAYDLALLRPGLYHPDGQILDEVYVYGSFLQSRMYANGVTCANCHDPHTAAPLAEGNAICTQCHSPAGNPNFPSLRLADYDTPAHTHHPENSEGANCRNCHMIERTYMGIDGRRDHSFRIPRPDLAAITGAPDACTDCHSDRAPEWASAQIADWFPDPSHRGPHFGETLARGREDPAAASSALTALALDQSQPSLARATALWLLQNGTAPDDLEPFLQDPDPLIRAKALPLLRAVPVAKRLPRLAELLRDSSRNVRFAAAQEILGSDRREAAASDAPLFKAALDTLGRVVSNQLDFPETHMKLAGIALAQRRFDDAMHAYSRVTEQDPRNVDAWFMQVRIAAALRGPAEARKLLSRALAANPGNPALLDLAAQL